MSKKLIFIMADSEAYLRDEVLRIIGEWGFTKNNLKSVEEWNGILANNTVSLFGDTSITHLDLSDGNKLKKFVAMLDDKKEKDKFKNENWFGAGLIITSVHARGAKKIETLVEKTGGSVVKKSKPDEMKKILLSRVKLNSQSKDFLDSFAGDDYQILVGIINEIEKMDKDAQSKLTIDDLIVRLPSKPGSLPPWEFVNPMLEGNAKKAIELYERSVEGSHVLVTMKLARTKLQLMYRLKVLMNSGVTKSQDQAVMLNERNGPNIWITAKVAQKLDLKTTEYLATLALQAEADLKGYSSVDPDLIFRNFIATTCLAIKHNTIFVK